MKQTFLKSFGGSLFVINVVLYLLLGERAWHRGIMQLSVALVGLVLLIVGLLWRERGICDD